MDIIKLNKSQLDNKRVIKKDTVWTDGKLVYKNSFPFQRMREYYDIFYLLKGYEFENLIMPKFELYLEDKPFGYVTEYLCKYKSIKEYINRNNIPYKQKLYIIKQLIKTIKSMHNELEITHGDLNPSNIMIKNNDLKIIDFDNIGIKGVTKESSYKRKELDDMMCLALFIINIISESDFSEDSDLSNVIDLMEVSEEFKKYLSSCLKCDNSIMGIYPEKYIKEITGTVESNFKKKVRNIR